MTEQHDQQQQPPEGADEDPKVVIIGPDGMAVAGADTDADQDRERSVTDLVEQPAKVMRIGGMIRQLLEEVKAAPLDEKARQRLTEIHRRSIVELESGLSHELVSELERLSLPFEENVTPSGMPASTKPRNSGTAEQEQNGVTTPSSAATTFPTDSRLPARIARVLSTVKNERAIPTTKTMRASSSSTLGVS